jgi:hypothetical protein
MPDRLQTEFELKLPKLWYVLACIGLLLLAIVSLIPVPDLGGSDKFGHFISYALLSAYLSLLVEQRKSLWRVSFTGYRSGDLADALANSLGAITGLAFYFSPLRRILRNVDRWLVTRL